MDKITLLLFVAFLLSAVSSLPLESADVEIEALPQSRDQTAHSIRRRFINPLFSLGAAGNDDIGKMRTKRSYDECEKLQLCKLHARSRQSFFAAYELYFVNKENARYWDHHARSTADCEQRYGDCYNK